MKTLPPLFLERLNQIVPEEISANIVDSFSLQRPVFFRRNTDAFTAELIERELGEAGIPVSSVSWYSDAFSTDASNMSKLQDTDLYRHGHVYIQGLSSMLPVLMLKPMPGDNVLDMCAAPGSKSTQLALMLEGQGKLLLNEKIKERFFRLKKNIDLQGFQNTELSLKPGAWFGRGMPEVFDKVLLDAPCSSEGRFHFSKPKSFQYWKPMKIKECQKKQKRLFRSAVHALKPGGLLLYSTCTFAPEENEAVIDWALRTMPDEVEALSLELPVSNYMAGLTCWKDKTYHNDVKKTARILPDEEMESFFMALIKKKENHAAA